MLRIGKLHLNSIIDSSVPNLWNVGNISILIPTWPYLRRAKKRMMVGLHPAFPLRARNYATRQQVELCPKYSSRVAGSQQYTLLLLKVIQEEENILPDILTTIIWYSSVFSLFLRCYNMVSQCVMSWHKPLCVGKAMLLQVLQYRLCTSDFDPMGWDHALGQRCNWPT